jgi:hypothetical protein
MDGYHDKNMFVDWIKSGIQGDSRERGRGTPVRARPSSATARGSSRKRREVEDEALLRCPAERELTARPVRRKGRRARAARQSSAKSSPSKSAGRHSEIPVPKQERPRCLGDVRSSTDASRSLRRTKRSRSIARHRNQPPSRPDTDVIGHQDAMMIGSN